MSQSTTTAAKHPSPLEQFKLINVSQFYSDRPQLFFHLKTDLTKVVGPTSNNRLYSAQDLQNHITPFSQEDAFDQ